MDNEYLLSSVLSGHVYNNYDITCKNRIRLEREG
jgi:hypothetical protein